MSDNIGMKLTLNLTNRHEQNSIFSKDVSKLLEFSSYGETQQKNSDVATLANIKKEPDFEPGEVIWKTEPSDWSNENSDLQEFVLSSERENNSLILRDLLLEKKKQKSLQNESNGLEDDLELEPGESLVQLKLEPEEIQEIINTSTPPRPSEIAEEVEALNPDSTNASFQNGATVIIGNNSNSNENKASRKNSDDRRKVFRNGVLVKTIEYGESVRESIYASQFKGAIIYRPNDAAYAQLEHTAKLAIFKNVPFAIEVTHTHPNNTLNAGPFHRRCKKCGESIFVSINHFLDHLRHHNYSKIYCMICQRGVSAEIYAEKHAELHVSNHVECNECFRLFPTKEHLKNHKFCHKGKPPFRCENCPLKFFLTYHQMKKHVKKCTKDMFKCNKCKLVFENKKKLDEHSCAAANLLECEKCLKIFESEENLRKHKRKIHKNVIRLTYDCKLCENSYDSYQEFLVHRVSHILEYSDKTSLKPCQICQLNFSSIYQLGIHLKFHTERKYHCAICHFGYTRQKHVIHHLKVHELHYRQCHQCFVFYKDQKELKYHERRHRMGPPFQCEYCPNLQFQHFNDIRMHITKNHLNYKCRICNKKFKLLAQLTVHSQTHEKNFSCKKCGKKFARVDYLAKHKTIHTKVRAYKCPDCKHTFSRSDNFKVHLRKMHKSDKEYSCMCGMKFSHKVLYSMHKNIHRGNNSFTCDFCKARFKKFPELKKHIMIDHLKIAKHTCDVCKEDFLKHDSLIAHYDKRHKNISSVCDVCGKEFDSYSKLKKHKGDHEIEAVEMRNQPAAKKRKL